MSEQTWNFAGIEGGASEIHGAVGTTAGLLDEGKGSLAALGAVWGGTGSEAYQAVQMRWDTTSNELNSALQNLAQTISESGATMAQTEAGVTGMFA
ncbi:MAG: WXG100 family type VII secretion target [Mycobacterium sp.]